MVSNPSAFTVLRLMASFRRPAQPWCCGGAWKLEPAPLKGRGPARRALTAPAAGACHEPARLANALTSPAAHAALGWTETR